jgi:phage shock protein E
VIDVRTPEEVAQGHIEGALLIPIAELEARMAEVDAAVAGDKHKKVVTYCKAGRRAGQAKLALEQHGYSNVVNGGGYDDLK